MISNSVNLVLQGKGGVGKSFISSMLAQYFLDNKKIEFFGADTDPVNQSFSSISRLNIAEVKIMENSVILQNKFDAIFENIINFENQTFVVDNGAASFVPMIKYINDNDIISVFDEMNRPIFIHTVIVGGQSENDTLQGLVSLYELISNSKNVNLVVWLNEFQGDIQFDKNIEKLVKNKVAGKVSVKNWNSDAFTADIEKMTKARLTLAEVLTNADFGLMSKNRLKRVYNDVYLQLDTIFDLQQKTAEKGE
ncbi:nucleotide-binding protein [Lonepinella sp. BR2882]|uniref:nucleotide-binding protein n=1 Tax=Lonepinella sp. BR2882 TaxID=3095283 RepID=UPI003F6E40F9